MATIDSLNSNLLRELAAKTELVDGPYSNPGLDTESYDFSHYFQADCKIRARFRLFKSVLLPSNYDSQAVRHSKPR